MVFKNRYQAGELLADELKKLKLDLKSSVIVAIPRGGVIVGQAISSKLKFPLTVVVVKKLGAPGNPELALGATASFGEPVLDRWLIRDLDVPSDYLKKETLKKKKEAKAREKFLGISLGEKTFRDRHVIVVDDGLATGQTARAAAKIIKKFMPKKLILAIPCASPATVGLVGKDYDQVICLEINPDLYAVGQFYSDFRPVEDEEVKAILNQN